MNENRVTTSNNAEEITIGRWGKAWQKFMLEYYPNAAARVMKTNRWTKIALEIDNEADEMWELLRSQYAKANPGPTDFMEILKWENTRGFYVDHEIMTQIVLQVRE